MRNLQELFKDINELKEFAVKRAQQELKARGYPDTVYVSADFYDDCIEICLKEKTGYDEYYETMFIDNLEMSDDDWNKFIMEITERRLAREAKDKQKREEYELNVKRNQYEKLKKELGFK